MIYDFDKNSPVPSMAKIEEMLLTLGIYPKYKGYKYLIDAALFVINDKNAVNNLTQNVYPNIAKTNNTTITQVQSAIRNVIDVMYCRGNTNKINTLFGFNIVDKNTKLTSADFIGMFANEVVLSKLI